ncbi:serine protease [Halobacteriovorax sp.]|uniref:trypsin-like serine peptidase n=1 Tax=Halobacteriovorax sp. TaxID=2020862 RepID=UPI00356AE77A
MNKISLIISLGLLLTISSCEDDVAKCEDTFKSDYNSLKESFTSIYNSTSSTEEFNLFSNSVTEFTSKYPSKCTVDGEVYDVKDELTAFVSQSTVKELLGPKVIYGKDDRLDIANSTDPRHAEWAKSVAIQISSISIGENGELSPSTIQETMSLCPTEEFANQINPGRCSGFLVGENTLVTAGHCVEDLSDCTNNKWVFNFQAGTSTLDSSQIYSCKSIISQELSSSTNADYAVIELDRVVENARPLTFRTSGEVKAGDNITVMGHPSGLPMKVAAGATIRSASDDWYFVGNLDTFGGNSGSPVFNTDTGVIEGILVRGETDYSWSRDDDGNSCRVVYQCEDDSCRGEDVTRITKVTGLPKQVTSAGILAEFFDGSDLSLENKGIAFKVQVKQGADKYLAGTKFLDLCAMHTAQNETPFTWEDSTIVNCDDEDSLLQIVETYRQ